MEIKVKYVRLLTTSRIGKDYCRLVVKQIISVFMCRTNSKVLDSFMSASTGQIRILDEYINYKHILAV